MFVYPLVKEVVVVLRSEISFRDVFALLNDRNKLYAGYLAKTLVDTIHIWMYLSGTQCKALKADGVGANP